MDLIRAKNIKLIPLSEIKLNPKNRNKHPPEQIEHIARIIKKTGFRRPGTISNRSGLLVCGEGRYHAAKKIGLKEMPVMFQDYESEDQEYADGIADNALDKQAELDNASILQDVLDLGPDFDFDLLGIPDFKLPEDFEPQCDEDAVPEHIEPKTKLGDLYQLGEHRLLCGDSTSLDELHKILPDQQRVDLVFTDPPYGIDEETDRAFASRTRKAKGNSFPKIIGDKGIDTAIGAYSTAIIKSDKVCFWGGNYFAHKLEPSACWIVWDKRVEENQRDMNSDCELAHVTHPNKKSVRIFRHLWKGMIKDSEHGQGRVHPTQKPIALAEWCFGELDPQGKTVLDLFGGSGSTLIACEKTKRKCFMMELDPHYCDVIVARWEKYTGKKAELIGKD